MNWRVRCYDALQVSTEEQRQSMRDSNKVKMLALVVAVMTPAVAMGYGVEIPENGAVAFGRGGAFLTRASDASTVMHNVAGIMGLPGLQVTIGSNVGVFSHCFQRTGNYDGGSTGASVDATGTRFAPAGSGDAPYASGSVPYPEQCKEFGLGLAPMVLGLSVLVLVCMRRRRRGVRNTLPTR
jgi:hypothetical protein